MKKSIRAQTYEQLIAKMEKFTEVLIKNNMNHLLPAHEKELQQYRELLAEQMNIDLKSIN